MGRIRVELASGQVLEGLPALGQGHWERTVGASRLRLSCRPARSGHGDGRGLAGRSLLFSEGPDGLDANTARLPVDSLSIVLDEEQRRLVVTLPLIGTTPLFCSASAGSLVLSDDLRELYRADYELDDRGVYSLLQFGSVAAPFSLWRQVQRLAPGYSYAIDTDSFQVSKQPHDFWQRDEQIVGLSQESPQNDPDKLLQILDTQLQELCPDGRPVILFSGGVDSGLLAARARALGWQDALLVHYSFGAEDPESELARAMAQHLGLDLITVEDGERSTASMLEAVGSSYFFPFGDFSSLPTYHLARAAAELAGDRRYVLDGTGADGGFGMYAKAAAWKRVYSLPEPVRRWAGAAYAVAGTWHSEGRRESLAKVLRRAGQMPLLLSGVLAQNAHAGISYRPSAQAVAEVHASIDGWVNESMGALSLDQRYCALDLSNICCDIFAQKNKALFAASPLEVGYPFLAADVVRLALLEAFFWPGSADAKAALKELLCRSLPPAMVYRKKSGFEPPMAKRFAEEAMQGTFHGTVLSERNPLLDYIDRKNLLVALEGARKGRRLPKQLYNFMWSLLFSSLWLEQVEHSSRGCQRSSS
jgi:asparagine synthetase B (glutamine-hydrolysing)